MRGNQIKGADQQTLLAELGGFVRKSRAAAGMTREALSQKSGVASDAIFRLEADVAMPSLPKFIALIGALGVLDTPIAAMAPCLMSHVGRRA